MKELVMNAANLFIEKDIKLLRLKVYELAVSHRIAVHMENLIYNDDKYAQIKEFDPNIDCEYDKIIDAEKLNESGRPIRPDILVHVRESDINLIAIEIKKDSTDTWDYSKLKTLTNQNGKYKYKLGAFIYFPNNVPKYKWFINGDQV